MHSLELPPPIDSQGLKEISYVRGDLLHDNVDGMYAPLLRRRDLDVYHATREMDA